MNPIRKPHHVRRPLVALTTAALALTVTLGACGRDEGGDASEGQGEAISDGEASGTIEVWAMGTEGDVLGDFVSEFSDANPDADVKVTAIPWEAAHDKIANAIASGETFFGAAVAAYLPRRAKQLRELVG